MTALRTLLVLGLLLLVPVAAHAVTVRDIIELTKAGLPDEILVAVIDADRTIFTLDKDQILALKQAGVSRAVLLKMLRTRREFEPPPAPPVPVEAALPQAAPQPEVVVIGATPAPPPVTVVVPQYVPQYLYVPVPIWGVPRPHAPRIPAPPVMAPERRGFGRFINDGWVERR